MIQVQLKLRKRPKTYVCLQCGADAFNRARSVSPKYCSRSCKQVASRNAKTFEVVCTHCGTSTQKTSGQIGGKAAKRRFCSRKCASAWKVGPNNPMYKHGFFTSKKGYASIRVGGRTVRRCRYVMEQHIGRPLLRHEEVHHRNGDRLDDRIENLELWSKSHPCGQRVSEKIAWAIEFLSLYGLTVSGADHDRDVNAAVNTLNAGRGMRLEGSREAASGISI